MRRSRHWLRQMSSSSYRPDLYELSFADASVTVACLDRAGLEVLSFLFPSIATCPQNGTQPDYRIRALALGRLALYRGDQLIYLGDSRGHLAELLMGEVCRDLVVQSSGGAVYHAGLVERDGVSLMLPGISGAGKSTLTAWLCSQGWHYHTDELVYVAKGGTEIAALPRALSLKDDPRSLLPDLAWAELESHTWASASGLLIAADGLNPHASEQRLSAGYVLFGCYSAGEPLRLEALSPAQTVLLLLQSLVNAPNLADSGTQVSIALGRELHGYQAIYSHLSELEALIASMAGISDDPASSPRNL